MDSQRFNEIKEKLRLTNQEISDTMGVRFDTVIMWDGGLWEMPLMAEKFLYTLLSVKRNNDIIYKEAFIEGRHDGREEGMLDIVAGYTHGYSEGYSAAMDEQETWEYY